MDAPTVDKLYSLAQDLALAHEGFFEKMGPGTGDKSTNAFMAKLRQRAIETFGRDFSEAQISGENRLAVDFYFPHARTAIEIALSLRNSNTEFERDILKALMANACGNPVSTLVFISKPGATKRLAEPAPRAIMAWVRDTHGLAIEVRELVPGAA